MNKFWEVIADDIRIRMDGSTLPREIEELRIYSRKMDGAIPIEPFPASIAYDESNPEVLLATAYAYAKRETGLEPIVIAEGVSMPTIDPQRKPGVLH